MVSLNIIKTWFKTGLKPTQLQFWDTWDSFWHKDDMIPINKIDGVNSIYSAINNHINDSDLHVKFIKSNENLSLALRKENLLINIIDQFTGESVTLELVSYVPVLVDGIIFFQVGSEYFKRVFNKINIEWFGAIGDDSTDDTESFQKALDFLLLSGGELSLPAKTFLIAGQLNIPDNLEATNPKMASTILKGSGANHTGRGTAPIGGTILDLRYNGTYGKIIGLGLGFLKITDISFIDNGDSDTAFIYTTYPTLHIKDCSFYGSKPGLLSGQDAIVMGGVEDSEGPKGLDVGFQGYGTIIEGNYFSRIRRAIYGRVFFNANVIINNTIWNTCGTNDLTMGAIEIDGDPENNTSQRATGNIISGNLIEATNYAHCIVLKEAEKNTLIANNFYDETVTLDSFYKLHDTALFNTITAGFHNDVSLLINEDSLEFNTVINNHQNSISNYSEIQEFKGDVRIKPKENPTAPKSPVLINDVLTEFYYRIEVNNRVSFYKKLNGELEDKLFTIRDFGGGVKAMYINGTDSRLESDGTLRIRSGGESSELYLGDNNGKFILVLDGRIYSYIANGIGIQPFRILSKTAVENLTVQRIDNGTLIAPDENAINGAKLFTGIGSPESVVTALVGSLYTRTDGGTNTTLYIKESGTGNTGWIAK